MDEAKKKAEAEGGYEEEEMRRGYLSKGVPEAFGGLSAEEMKLIHLMRTFDIIPQVDDPDSFPKIAKVLRGEDDEEDEEEEETIKTPVDVKKPGMHHYPKFSIFYGEEGKGEVTWDTFKYEVMSLMADKTFTEEQIMFGIRRALKGKAGDKIRRLGVGATPEFVLLKLDSDYGSVENKETALRKFYTCEQQPSESVEAFATRLEELFYKAVELKAFELTDTDILKQCLHSGLKRDLKQMSVYQCDKIKGYDDFKKELRKIESEMKETPKPEEKKPCKPAVNSEKRDNSEITQLLRQLNERIDRLEQGQKQKESDDDGQMWYSRRGVGRGRWRGNTRGRGNFRGRGTYRPQRPFASGTFAPTCFLCNRKGHVQKNCPTILAQLVCSNCREKGHIRKDCPNL